MEILLLLLVVYVIAVFVGALGIASCMLASNADRKRAARIRKWVKETGGPVVVRRQR